MLGLLALITSISLIIFGAHGLYAYFNTWDTIGALMSENYDKLFFAISVPHQISGLVSWMSLRGLQSFFVPAIFLLVGLMLARYSNEIGFDFSFPRFKLPSPRFKRKTSASGNYRHLRDSYINGTDIKNNKSSKLWLIIATRTALNIVIFIGPFALVWYGFKVFSHETTPLVGALTFLIGAGTLWILIWLLRKKYLWVGPSFRITSLVFTAIIVVFAFAGVEPVSGVKDNVKEFVSNIQLSNNTSPSTPPKTKQVGSWLFSVSYYKHSGTTLVVDVSITNKSKQPLVFDSSSTGMSYPGLIAVDSYRKSFAPQSDVWYSMKTIYPDKQVSGRLLYKLNDGSTGINLYLGMNTGLLSPVPYQLLFGLE